MQRDLSYIKLHISDGNPYYVKFTNIITIGNHSIVVDGAGQINEIRETAVEILDLITKASIHLDNMYEEQYGLRSVRN